MDLLFPFSFLFSLPVSEKKKEKEKGNPCIPPCWLLHTAALARITSRPVTTLLFTVYLPRRLVMVLVLLLARSCLRVSGVV